MSRVRVVFSFTLLLLGCNSTDPIENPKLEYEEPELLVKMERDTITQTWNISYVKGDFKDTIFTERRANYTYIDTANLDGGLSPEYIVSRDSVISSGSGIDQRGYWSYAETCRVIDIWSLDKKEVILSIISGKHFSTQHSDELIPLKTMSVEQKGINLNWTDFYEYDVEFKFGEIVITNLRSRKNSRFKPDFVEGRYHINNGNLELTESIKRTEIKDTTAL